ncbi:PREDICTED: uncharacterized protein LOC108973202 [Bactrocera latifrons]|uniref:uncharacterized protein LOC108973202 n=1 Tax=Bactrocera latifrons TaxID=174628 RepID=UPI0008DCFFA2|nr:PREDICTED: uncharacterized protein LOC108973202 [Bactrocera latifrons]
MKIPLKESVIYKKRLINFAETPTFEDVGCPIILRNTTLVSIQKKKSKFSATPLQEQSLHANAHPIIRGHENVEFANFSKLIEKIRMERAIETVVMFKAFHDQQSCLGDDTLRSLHRSNITVILLNATSSWQLQGADVNSELLVARCVAEPIQPHLLNLMVRSLGVVRDVRIVFIWNVNYVKASPGRRNELQQQLRKLFMYCASTKLLNVISVYSDFESEGHYYTYSYFPSFHLERKQMQNACFPNRLKDMQGTALRTLPDQNEPRSIVWRDRWGRLQNETIDFLMGLTGIGWKLNASQVSAPVISMFWATMLPRPPKRPIRDIYVLIFTSVIGLILLLLLLIFSCLLTCESMRWRHNRRTCSNACRLFLFTLTNVSLRSMLGQPTHVHITAAFTKRFICSLLFVAGIYVSTISTSYLQTYLTSSPKLQRVNTFDELLCVPTRIKISLAEYNALEDFVGPRFLEKYTSVFLITPSINDYYYERKTLNTHFGYTVPQSLWKTFVEYQRRLGVSLFYISDQMILAKNLQMGIPLSPHSIYRDKLNALIQNLISAGLVEYWEKLAYGDMVAAGKLNKTISTPYNLEHSLTLGNLYWIWWLYGKAFSGIALRAEQGNENSPGLHLGCKAAAEAVGSRPW